MCENAVKRFVILWQMEDNIVDKTTEKSKKTDVKFFETQNGDTLKIINVISDNPTYTKKYIEHELYRIFAKYFD